VKAIELVRKVASLGASLRKPRDDGTRGTMAIAGRAVALRIVQATTVAARQMQSLPIPSPRPAERVALSAAAAQLRAMADVVDFGGRPEREPDTFAPPDPSKGDREIEVALGALVAETLALVDKVLATAPELDGPTKRELPPKKVTF
jgi:hypothetical protein